MITVLRLGHRGERDKRVTTHVALAARAFGAEKIVISRRDKELKKNIDDVTARFGGRFEVIFTDNWRKYLNEWEGKIIHLTMYGENIDDVVKKIPRDKDLLIVVGAEKVPKDVYEISDFNLAVGNQPHSEISALAVFLDRYWKGKALKKNFKGKIRIVPCKSGKKVVGK